MSGSNVSTAAVSRRTFLKAGGAAAAALGLAGAASMTTTGNWLAPAEANAEVEEKEIYTLHQFMCQGNCSLKCTVRDGRLCKIEPNDYVEKEHQRCCVKGIAEIQHVYSADRIQHPMRRVGERGSNEFEVITWDEALQTVGEEIKKAWSSYGKDSVYISRSNAPGMGMLASLLCAGTGGEPGIDIGVGNGIDPATGGSGYAGGSSDSRDWVNTKTLIMAGCNYLESSLAQSREFFDAMDAGCETIIVDPHYSTTASKASQWVPIKPGTDAALFLAMITHIVDNKWYDEDYMRKYTSFPFLVESESGALLRVGEEKLTDEDGEELDPGDYMVWDLETGTAVRHDSASGNIALEGTYTVGGKQYETVFNRLKKTQKEYTTSWAEEITGISKDKIEELAEKYSCNSPSVLAFGYGGNDKFSNPDVTGHAYSLLVGLTGNVGKPGAAFGAFTGGAGHGASLASWPLPDDMVQASLDMQAYNFRTQKNDIHVIISLGNTLQQYYANMNTTREWLKTLDFVLHVGLMYEDSVAYADIVLPVCSSFEDTVEHGIVRTGYNHVLLQTKCIEPLFDSKPDFEVQRLICEAVGLDDVLPKDSEEWARYQLDNADDPALEGIDFETLIANHCSMPLVGSEEPRIGFTDQVFDTPTTKLEVYYEPQVKYSQALPTWVQNNEAYEGSPLSEKYPLQFTQTRSRFFIHSHLQAAEWIRQFRGTYLEVNPQDLESRGIADNDLIEAFNDRGSFTCHVRANAAVHPGSSRIIEGAWSKFIENGNPQDVTNDTLQERGELFIKGPVIPFNDTLIEIKKA